MNWWPRISAAERAYQGKKRKRTLTKAGHKLAPVVIEGRAISRTFWGKAWCTNLERYSDYENRLPRGRTYARNGCVIDLQIDEASISSRVSGRKLYDVEICIARISPSQWSKIKAQCAGQIDSLLELLEGNLSKKVMEIVTRPGHGLFPTPREISLSCSCPDWATMCKHVAATLYGVGARLDHHPELLFMLRGVDPTELVEAAFEKPEHDPARRERAISSDDLSSIFGVEIVSGLNSEPEQKRPRKARQQAQTYDGTSNKVVASTSTAKRSTTTPAKTSKGKKLQQNRDTPAKLPAESIAVTDPEIIAQCKQLEQTTKTYFRKKLPIVSLYTHLLPRGQTAPIEEPSLAGQSPLMAEPAVDCLASWWLEEGLSQYPGANEILILIDCAGLDANGNRVWLHHLQNLADLLEIRIAVCHRPRQSQIPKYVAFRHLTMMKIEQSKHGQKTCQVTIEVAHNRKRNTVLRVSRPLEQVPYAATKQLTEDELERVNLVRNGSRGDWNYSLMPW